MAVVLVKYTLTLMTPHPLNGVFLSFVRFTLGIFWCLVFMTLVKGGFHFQDRRTLVLRGLTGSISMVLFYIAVQVNSSGRAILLSDTYPIFVAVFGFLFFKERLRRNHLISLLLSVTGAFLVLHDNSSYQIQGDLLALASALFGGLAVHYIKKSRERNNPMVVYLVSCLFGVVLSFVPAGLAFPAVYPDLTPMILFFFVSIGTLVFLGQQLMTFGFKYISATSGSILSLSEIILTVFMSALFLDETITLKFLIGGVLVVMGLILALRDRGNRQPVLPDL